MNAMGDMGVDGVIAIGEGAMYGVPLGDGATYGDMADAGEMVGGGPMAAGEAVKTRGLSPSLGRRENAPIIPVAARATFPKPLTHDRGDAAAAAAEGDKYGLESTGSVVMKDDAGVASGVTTASYEPSDLSVANDGVEVVIEAVSLSFGDKIEPVLEADKGSG